MDNKVTDFMIILIGITPHLIVTRQVIYYLETDSLIASIQTKFNEKSFKSVSIDTTSVHLFSVNLLKSLKSYFHNVKAS